MQNYKNRRRLTVIVVAFMLTFLVGAAFASIPGALQVAGGIGIGDPNLRVRWYEILDRELVTVPGLVGTVSGYSPAILPLHASTDMARIVNFMAIGASSGPIAPQGEFGIDDRLEWAIGFTSEGSVSVDVRALNYGSLTAELLAPSHFAWLDNIPMFHDMFTVTYSVLGSTGTTTAGTWPVILEASDTVDIRITVTWDGSLPPGGFDLGDTFAVTPVIPPANNWNVDGWLIDLLGGISNTHGANYDWANNFFFNLVYQLAP